jgi:hypothetical protein
MSTPPNPKRVIVSLLGGPWAKDEGAPLLCDLWLRGCSLQRAQRTATGIRYGPVEAMAEGQIVAIYSRTSEC